MSLFLLFLLVYCQILTASSSCATRGRFTMNSLQNVAAVIFDLDGTLLDTETLSTKASEMVLEKYGVYDGIDWALKKRILGLRGDEWSRIVVEDKGLVGKLDPKVLVQEWEENLGNLCESIEKMPGALELVEALAEKGIPMAIATSSSHYAVHKKQKRHMDIFSKMKLIVCGDDAELRSGKPSPDIYLLAARRLVVDPAVCVVVEDALSGVQSGTSAGAHVVIACPDPRIVADSDAIAAFTAYNPRIVNSLLEVAAEVPLWNNDSNN